MSKFSNALPLKLFIQRSQVRKLFRDLFKATRTCQDPQLKQELRHYIRTDFRKNKNIEGNALIKSHIQEGLQSLKKVQDLCESTIKKRIPEIHERTSWLEEGEGEPENEKRGRVGVGWPWDREK
jgi:hypothetical protein